MTGSGRVGEPGAFEEVGDGERDDADEQQSRRALVAEQQPHADRTQDDREERPRDAEHPPDTSAERDIADGYASIGQHVANSAQPTIAPSSTDAWPLSECRWRTIAPNVTTSTR